MKRGSQERHPNSGMVLPIVVLAMLVLALFFAAMSFLSRGQVTGAIHYLDSSRAVILADAAVRKVVQELASGAFEPNPTVIPPAFYTHLFSASTEPWHGPIEPSAAVKDFVREIGAEGRSVDLDIQIGLQKLTPLPHDTPSGIAADPIEKSGEVEITAVATVGNASRRIRITKGIKVFQAVHPLLAKFTLFVKSPPTTDREARLNPLKRLATKRGFADNLLPLQLENGVSFQVVENNNLVFANRNMTPATIAQIERQAGWVYLGGNQTWGLGLSGPGLDSEFDDRSVLRYATYPNKNPDLAWGEALIAKGGASRVDAFLINLEGMREELIVRGAVRPLRDLLFTRFMAPVPTGVSLLRLFGRGDKVSPTLVFGPVERRYLQVQAINCTIGTRSLTGVAVPGFHSESDFTEIITNPPAPYAGDFNYFRILFELDPSTQPAAENWRKFQTAMSRVATESYNSGLDYLVSNRERNTITAPQGDDTGRPVTPGAFTGQLSLWQGTGADPLEAMRQSEGTIRTESGRSLFQGNLSRIEGLAEILPKTTARFSSAADFLAETCPARRPGTLQVPGVALVQGDLTFDRPLTVTRGGIIIATGTVTITAPLGSTGEPLTIISEKDIVVNCAAPQSITAHLICLRGQFRALSPSFHIIGGLAARELDLDSLKTPGPKTITFAPAHDPLLKPQCLPNENGTLYRFRLSPEELYAIEPGKS